MIIIIYFFGTNNFTPKSSGCSGLRIHIYNKLKSIIKTQGWGLFCITPLLYYHCDSALGMRDLGWRCLLSIKEQACLCITGTMDR